MRRWTRYCLLATVVVLLLPPRAAYAGEIPVIDLKQSSRIVLQNMPWEFHWQKYLYPDDFIFSAPVPDLVLPKAQIWNTLMVSGQPLDSFGFATYRVRFKVAAVGDRLGLRIPTPLAAYRVFVNGQKLAEEGRLTESEEGFVARRKTALLFFEAPGGEIDLVIQVANFLLYKGGLRTDIELSEASAMQFFGMRYLAVDLFSIGLIFSIMLYHFLLYFLSKKNVAILVFAFVSLDYFLLATLFGEQSISLFFPQFPVEFHARLNSAFAFLLPALVVHFTAALYPGVIPRRIQSAFWVVAVLFIVTLSLPLRYIMAYNVYYYGGAGAAGASVSLWCVYHAIREKKAGARILGAGILILFILTIYAVYLYATHSQAGSFLSVGFSLFALAQSGSVAHAHASLSHENANMLQRLDRSRNALDNQRKQIEANLHDSLGGNLTDIKLGLEALGTAPLARAVHEDIRRLDKRVAGTIASLRTELLFLEDMQLAAEDFVSGINLILLRRYQMAHRPVDISISPETRARSQQLKETEVLTAECIPELCMIVQELCSNSLKYSIGVARWEIIATDKTLEIVTSGKSRYRSKKTGLGKDTLKQRVARIGARLTETAAAGTYEAVVSLP